MNTKNKIIAILMASIVAMAVGVPMAMSQPPVSEATVNNILPHICEDVSGDPCIWIEPDDDGDSTNGIQIMPNPYPNNTAVTIEACVCDGNGEEDIVSVCAEVQYENGTTKIPQFNLTRHPDTDWACNLYCNCTYLPEENPCWQYNGTFDMGPCQPAENYTVIVKVTDQNGSIDTETNTFEYLSLVALTLNFDKVSFGPADPGTPLVPGNESMGGAPVNSTIHCAGNDPINITVEATDLTDGLGHTIGGDNMSADVDELGWQRLNATWGTCLECCNTTTLDFWLDIPNVKPHTYTGSIIITPTHC